MKTKIKTFFLLCIVAITVAEVCEEILLPDGRLRTNCSYSKPSSFASDPIPMDGKITAPSTNPLPKNTKYPQIQHEHIQVVRPPALQMPPSNKPPKPTIQTELNVAGEASAQQIPTTTAAPITQQDVAQVMDLIEDILDTVKALQQVINLRKSWEIGDHPDHPPEDDNTSISDISDSDLSGSEEDILEEVDEILTSQVQGYPNDVKPPFIINTPQQPHGITPQVVHLPAVIQTANDFGVAQDILEQNLQAAYGESQNASITDMVYPRKSEHQEAADRMQKTLDDMQKMINAAAQDIPLSIQREVQPVQAKMLAEAPAFEEEPEPQTVMLPAGAKTTPKPKPPHKH